MSFNEPNSIEHYMIPLVSGVNLNSENISQKTNARH